MRVRFTLRRSQAPSPGRALVLGVFAAVAGLLGPDLATGQSSENFELKRSVIAGGGASGSEQYGVTGALGQAEADPSATTSERYLVRGGFFTAQAIEPSDLIFMDGFED